MIYRPRIWDKLVLKFKPLHLEVTNESRNHGLPESAEKHFRVVVVSEAMANLSRVERHRAVNEALAQELQEHVHALSIQAFTPEEWEKKGGQTFASPPCLGGSKLD